ncbi:MAG: hypothetical protein HQ472_08760 [Ignavibacteria bacterium]|nr:hypothetical protein [Ignavibacteria bacterium]
MKMIIALFTILAAHYCSFSQEQIVTSQVGTESKSEFVDKFQSICPSEIEGLFGNSNLPYCMDSLVINSLDFIEGRDPKSTVTQCVKVFRKNELGEYIEVNTATNCGVGAKTMVIKFLEPFVSHLSDPTEVATYKMVVICGYWAAGSDLIQQRFFQKQNVLRAYTVARMIGTEEIVFADTETMPPLDSVIQPISSKLRINTVSQTDSLQFSHWTCSADGIPYSPSGSNQVIEHRCWPQRDTVIFTAWYKKITSAVSESAGASGISVECDQINHRLNFRNCTATMCRIFNLHGTLVSMNVFAGSQQLQQVPLELPQGLYVIVCELGNGKPFVKPFIYLQP